MLALAFAPISLFFLITANNYAFFKLLNVAILVLSALVGLRFLTCGMATLNRTRQRTPARRRAKRRRPALAPAAPDGAVGDGEPAVAGLVEPTATGRPRC